MADKYKVERTREGLFSEVERTTIKDTETGKSASAARFDWDKKTDTLQKAKDKLRANE